MKRPFRKMSAALYVATEMVMLGEYCDAKRHKCHLFWNIPSTNGININLHYRPAQS